MTTLGDYILYYKQEDIAKEILACAEGREVAVKYGDKGFGKRPDMLRYPRDVLEFVLQGATSFHCSEERWKNPLMLDTGMSRQELDRLRSGWDLVIDIDCRVFEYSRIAAYLIVNALKSKGIGAVSVKFSGNKGFHIGVPFESFPDRVHGKPTASLFPDGARRIALYLKNMIEKRLAEGILAFENGKLEGVIEKTGRTRDEIILDVNGRLELDVSPFLEIDTLLISSRHMFRMPYSFNEKAGLISLPLDPGRVLEFEKAMAHPRLVKPSKLRFLDPSLARPGEAAQLLIQAFDLAGEKKALSRLEEDAKTSVYSYSKRGMAEDSFEELTSAIPEELFPPCIRNILQGLEDGRKRALFILTNFLSKAGWSNEAIKERIKKWNEQNKEPLRENYITAQLRYHKQTKKSILPPNCDNQGYYIDLRVCKPDSLCKRIKNPVNYAVVKWRGEGKKAKQQKKK